MIGRSFPNAPFRDIDSAVVYLNERKWNLRITRDLEHIDVWAGDGEVHLFTAKSDEEIASFLLGMALVFYMIGPDAVPGFEQWED